MSSTEFRTKIKHLRQKISKLPVVLDLIGGLAYLYAWLAGKTGKFDVSGIDEFEKLIADNDGGIFVAWHGRALMLPYFWRNPRQMKALVSPHNDGRIIARLLSGVQYFEHRRFQLPQSGFRRRSASCTNWSRARWWRLFRTDPGGEDAA